LPTLRDLTRICRERYARPDNGHDWTNQNLAVSIARFTLACDQAGDASAAREYAEFIRTTAPEWLEQNALAALRPLYERPDDPTLAAAAAWLFGDPQSPWVPLVGRKGSRPSLYGAALIASPLLDVPAFRGMILAALADRAPIGTAESRENGVVTVKLEQGLVMNRQSLGNDDDAFAQGIVVPMRMCDFYAWELATLKGAPAFNPCWPEKRREAALGAMAAFVKRKSER
jgi:hypothetical protein